MSRSTSFWPSTIATRSSSAWVALNSMRFMAFSRRGSGRACGEAKRRPRDSRGVTLSGGGRGQSRPRAQRGLRRNESDVDACCRSSGVGLDSGEVVRSHLRGGFRRSVKAVRLAAVVPRIEGSRIATGGQPQTEIVANCAAQCAASNRPHAGCGDCALPLPSLLFRGATPGRSVDLTGGRFTQLSMQTRAVARNVQAVFAPLHGARLVGGAPAILRCSSAPPRGYRQAATVRSRRAKRAAGHNY